MTFDERLEQTLVEWGQACYHKWGGELQKKKAITAIKQAMREALSEKINNYNDSHAEAFVRGYNTAIDEIEKGFGLDG